MFVPMPIVRLGEARYASPLRGCIRDGLRVSSEVVYDPEAAPREIPSFELAGPRERLFFEPGNAKAGIVTCGGLCPGLNNVIRSIYHELHFAYGLGEVWGFRDGYQGLDPARCREPILLTSEFVDDIHTEGGTVIGTSRGPVDCAVAVDNLIRRGINMLFTIGGDGTQRGGNALFQEARKRNYPLAVVGVPKTIDNDVAYVARTFGFLTAVEEAAKVLAGAHVEARSVHNGISVVKLMGRSAGFIAAAATVASQDVNFCLIPEVPVRLDGEKGFLRALQKRIEKRQHALVVVAEGAGQDLVGDVATGTDASGNKKLADIGPWLTGKIDAHFRSANLPATIRYFDPSYSIRSVPADAEDAILCDLFARHAAHAAMAGKSGLVIGYLHGQLIHIPIDRLADMKKRVDPAGQGWHAVLAATGQPHQWD